MTPALPSCVQWRFWTLLADEGIHRGYEAKTGADWPSAIRRDRDATFTGNSRQHDSELLFAPS